MDSVLTTLEVVNTKFIAPRLGGVTVKRTRLIGKLRGMTEYPLTIVHGDAGYGKSSSVIEYLSQAGHPFCWYNVGEAEGEPRSFLIHLAYAFRTLNPGLSIKALGLLLWEEHPLPQMCGVALRALMNDIAEKLKTNCVIVLDDYHCINNNEQIANYVEPFIELCPPNLHIVLITRQVPSLPSLPRWKAKGKVNEINSPDLALTSQEAVELGQRYGIEIEEKEALALVTKTEGWIMAVHMAVQQMAKGFTLAELWAGLPERLHTLFDFLAHEFVQRQSKQTREFLITSALLSTMDAQCCDAILQRQDSAKILQYLYKNGIFTVCDEGGQYRYHQLFQGFLVRQLPSIQVSQQIHSRAAEFFEQRGDFERAIEHCMAAKLYQRSASLCEKYAGVFIETGYYDKLRNWLANIPEPIANAYPGLLLCQGDLARISNHYDDALAFYRRAEQYYQSAQNNQGMGQAAKGIALVYIDTIQPGLAEQYLYKSLELLDANDYIAKARVLKLLAENYTNKGAVKEAATYYQQANEVLHEATRGDLEARIYLRTGQLWSARRMLEGQLTHPERAAGQSRSFRETSILLSMLYSLMGESEQAYEMAKTGALLGQKTETPFVEAVGYIRMGHAVQLDPWRSLEKSEALYNKALKIFDTMHLQRGKAEALMGLCLLHGMVSNTNAAVSFGTEALKVSQQSKDEWFSAIVRLAMGIAYYHADDYEVSGSWFLQASASFEACGDYYGQTVCDLWLAFRALRFTRYDQLSNFATKALVGVREHGCEYLLTKPTLFALRDAQAVVPLLQAALQQGIEASYARSLLKDMGVHNAARHPGYALRIRTLGQFQVWRGGQEVTAKEWQREKAKQLLQLLVTYHGTFLHKEKIMDLIFPEAKDAERDFKVVLNALTCALEPNRPARSSSYFIVRHEALYGLNPEAVCDVDAKHFEDWVARGKKAFGTDKRGALQCFRAALSLYQGDYLSNCCYEDWTMEERERLLTMYITTVERVVRLLMEQRDYEQAIAFLNLILTKDGCWEEAYRLLMLCYYRLGNRSMVLKVFKQCADKLHNELGVLPMQDTMTLYQQLIAGAR